MVVVFPSVMMWLLTWVLTADPCLAIGERALLADWSQVAKLSAGRTDDCSHYFSGLAALRQEEVSVRLQKRVFNRGTLLAAHASFAAVSSDVLSDWARLRTLEIAWRLRDPALAPVGPNSRVAPAFAEAERFSALSLALASLAEAALSPGKETASELRLVATPPSRSDDRQSWLELLSELASLHSPRPSWFDRIALDLFVEFPDSDRAPLAIVSATKAALLKRSAVLHQKHMNLDVLKTVDAAFTMSPTDEERCELLYYQGAASRKMRRYGLALNGLDSAVRICRKALRQSSSERAGDLLKRARYLLGQVQLISAPKSLAEATMREFAKDYAGDSLADDALMAVAEALHKQERPDDAIAGYDAVRQLDGDQCAEAGFRAAYLEYLREHWKQALERFDALGQSPCAQDSYERSRALYWAARAASHADPKDTTIRSRFERIISQAPLSYYALLSRQQLGAQASTSPACSASREPSRLDATTEASRARALIRAGMYGESQAELRPLGARLGPDDLVAYSLLLGEAQDHHAAHMVFRTARRDVLGKAPAPDSCHAWLAAYPMPFREAIAAAERNEKLPELLLLALIREESAFQLNAGSWANAYGLTQLLVETATATAADMHWKEMPTAERLMREPLLSVQLGAHHLAMLGRSNKKIALLLASYNAGPGAVSRWLKRSPDKPLDEFVEEIPFDETRGYVKRILRSWAVYSTLNGLPLPKADATL